MRPSRGGGRTRTASLIKSSLEEWLSRRERLIPLASASQDRRWRTRIGPNGRDPAATERVSRSRRVASRSARRTTRANRRRAARNAQSSRALGRLLLSDQLLTQQDFARVSVKHPVAVQREPPASLAHSAQRLERTADRRTPGGQGKTYFEGFSPPQQAEFHRVYAALKRAGYWGAVRGADVRGTSVPSDRRHGGSRPRGALLVDVHFCADRGLTGTCFHRGMSSFRQVVPPGTEALHISVKSGSAKLHLDTVSPVVGRGESGACTIGARRRARTPIPGRTARRFPSAGPEPRNSAGGFRGRAWTNCCPVLAVNRILAVDLRLSRLSAARVYSLIRPLGRVFGGRDGR